MNTNRRGRWHGYRRALVGFLAALLVAGCSAPFGGERALHGMVFQQPRQLDFALTDAAGQPFSAADLDGLVALLFFGYTNCPDICPTTMADFAQVKQLLGARADDVRFVMITVDPERDTPDRLGRYVAGFDPSFIGLRGEPDVTMRLLEAYGIVAEHQHHGGEKIHPAQLIDHTAMAFLIDKQGFMRSGYTSGTSPDLVAADVTTLLAE